MKGQVQLTALAVITVLLSLTGGHTALAASDGGWQVNNELSRVSFVSIKATDIGEVHSFKRLDGTLSADGTVDITIDLASVETLIPIRNERMQESLFETGMFPGAGITAKLDTDDLANLTPGDVHIEAVEATLTLKDKAVAVTLQVAAAKVSESRLMVTTLQPVLLTAAAVGLSDGVEKLRAIAGLPNISQAVPVSVVITFDK